MFNNPFSEGFSLTYAQSILCSKPMLFPHSFFWDEWPENWMASPRLENLKIIVVNHPTTHDQIRRPAYSNQYHHRFSRPPLVHSHSIWPCDMSVPFHHRLPELHLSVLKPTVDANNIANYRPVSRLLFLSKTLEHAVLSLLSSHLQQKDHLDAYQSGSQSDHAFCSNCCPIE